MLKKLILEGTTMETTMWPKIHQFLYWLENYLFWAKIKRKLIKIALAESFTDYSRNKTIMINAGHKPPSKERAVVLDPDGFLIVSDLKEVINWIIKNYPQAAKKKIEGEEKIRIMYSPLAPNRDAIFMEVIID